ncbi:hypothetical protein LRS05_09405 [Flavobacterium sp. J372]|uniref:hypothetical protein n=1 Tax=Flavobacterium sp. J372 TaxID=2898436 RepID=UPI0021511DE6|nr:hypothetical protein [Flavobacterium sp. J372]MCR5862348.1 hypothetical protein [Flavobacterium sp. J372]
MRQYYDVYSLLANKEVQEFIGTVEYFEHKKTRFPKADLEIPIVKNEAFLLNNPEIRDAFRKRYIATASLYYNGQPEFNDLLERIKSNIEKL